MTSKTPIHSAIKWALSGPDPQRQSLARDGDPNHAGLPRWDRYELPTRQTLLFDVETRMANDPRGDERAFFAAIPYVQPGT